MRTQKDARVNIILIFQGLSECFGDFHEQGRTTTNGSMAEGEGFELYIICQQISDKRTEVSSKYPHTDLVASYDVKRHTHICPEWRISIAELGK